MADENKLKVGLSADTSGLAAALKSASGDFKNFSVSVNKSLGDSVKSFGDFKKEATGLGASFNIPVSLQPLKNFNKELITIRNTLNSGFQPAIDKIKLSGTNFSSVTAGAAGASRSLKTLGSSSNTAGFALTNLGRLAQDAQFGFIGIQNNLNPLLESFQRLKAESGSNSKALKALGSSLIGAGGIGLALSVVTTVIGFATMGFDAWTRGLGNSSKKAKEASDKTKEFVDSLKSISDLTSEATGSVQGQIISLQTLARAVQDTNKPYAERKNALQELKKINKAYFGDLTLEANSLATLTGRVNEYTKAIINQAVLKGFTDEISRVSVELSKQEKAFDKSKTKLNLLETELAKTKEFTLNTKGDEVVTAAFGKISKAVSDAREEFNDNRESLSKLDTSFAELSGSINKAQESALKLKATETETPEKTAKVKKEIDLLKERIDLLEKLRGEVGLLKSEQKELLELKVQLILRDSIKEGLNQDQISRKIHEEVQKLGIVKGGAVPVSIQPTYQIREETTADTILREATFNISKKALLGIDINIPVRPTLKIDTSLALPPGFNQPMIDRMKAAGIAAGAAFTVSLSERLGDITDAGIENAFASLGEGVGEALASGQNPIVAAGEAFLRTVGTVLQQIGKEIIKESELVIALKAALKAAIANPVASLVVGIALVAAGSALKNIKFNVPALATGGITTGPTLAQIGESGREAIIPLSKLESMIGNNTQEIFVRGEIHGDVIKLIYDRATISQQRRF